MDTKWNAVGNEFLKCPVEGCDHIGKIITKAHCRIAHNMTRVEVWKKYGYPKRVISKKGVNQYEQYSARN